MCMYVYVCVCITCIACMCMYVYVWVCIVCMCIYCMCMHVFVLPVCICMSVWVCMWLTLTVSEFYTFDIHTHTHTHTHTYIHIHTKYWKLYARSITCNIGMKIHIQAHTDQQVHWCTFFFASVPKVLVWFWLLGWCSGWFNELQPWLCQRVWKKFWRKF